ncbi:MAG: PVC-type heme-binding CxxCH protein [Verrucomicrobiia bacterium]|jgi:putative membrane-bound dehydrogenase-like protein
MKKYNRQFLTWACAALLCAAPWVHAAEPVADPNELPRFPPTEPADALKTFKVKKGFRLELVASEPLVTDPVSMSFDANGRLYVVEMRGYSEHREDSMGQIRLLEDTDYDGRMDKSTVFARELNWPTAVFCYDGGVFVGVTPDLWFMKDTNGDGVADLKKIVYTGFGSSRDRLNVQAMFNSLRWGLDNRIHGATAGNGGVVSNPSDKKAKPISVRGRDFSFDPRTMELRAIDSTAQHGMSFDDWGRKFICSNSSHLQTVMYDSKYAGRNPHYTMPSPRISAAADGAAAEVYRLSPDEPWRIVRTRWRATGAVRGAVEGGGRVSGYFTAATGVTIYRGSAYGDGFLGNAFIGDAGSNLIHRKKIRYQGVQPVGERPADEQKVEFIASTDNWFRPVQFANAPDGCLYVADMYRETIEHPWSIPEAIKKHVDLNSGNDRGRIYRIVPDGFKQPKAPNLKKASTKELVATLAHSNGWQRDTAARLLFERQATEAKAALTKSAKESSSAVGRAHSLHTLHGLKQLDFETVTSRLDDSDPMVVAHAIKLTEEFATKGQFPSAEKIQSLAGHPDKFTRYQLALTLGTAPYPGRDNALASLAQTDGDDKWIRAAIMNAAGRNPLALFNAIGDSSHAATVRFREQLAESIGRQKQKDAVKAVVDSALATSDKISAYRYIRAVCDGLRRSGSSLHKLSLQQAITGFVNEAALQYAESLKPALQATDKPLPVSPHRLAAIRLLAIPEFMPVKDPSDDFEQAHRLPLFNALRLQTILVKDSKPGLPDAEAIELIRAIADLGAWGLLANYVPAATSATRNETVQAMLTHRTGAMLLLKMMEAGKLRASVLSATQIAKLRSHRDAGIKKLASQILGPPPSKNRQSVVDSFLPAMRLKGDAAKGRLVYQKLCVSCHKIGAEGHALGPDLVTMKSMGREKILVNILDPNREVAPQYFGYSIDVKDGESYSGLIASENDNTVTLKAAFGAMTPVSRSDISAMKSTGMSIMPEGLEAGLPHQDMADLIEFIVTADAK